MEIPQSQIIGAEPAGTGHVSVPVSAIQKQQAAELLNVENPTPDLAISEQAQPKIKNRKKPWQFLIALLMLLLVGFLFFYEDVLWPLFPQGVAVSEPALEKGQLQRQLDMARELSLVLIEEPHRLGELVTIYRNVLVESPAQPEALSGLQQLPRQCLLLVSFYMASGQLDITREIVEDSLLYFPELAEDPLWLQLMINLAEQTVRASITADLADDSVEGQELGLVSESAPDVSTSLPVGMALASGSLQTARQGAVNRLLQEANDFSQKGIQFTRQENAVTRYQDVLALQPGQVDAVAGLQALVDNRVAYVKRLLSEKDLGKARLMLEPALRHFPDKPQLRALSSEIDEYGGVISSLTVDFLAEDKMDSALLTVGGQTLLLSFSYQYFPTTTTVVNAQLFSLPLLDAIAAVPLIMQHPRGSKTAQMSILSHKIVDGRYRLILSAADKQLIKYEFTVNNDRISNHGEL